MGEYKKRRDRMLTFFPEVTSAGNLADALSRAFAEEGSSQNAYSVVPPEKPTWSIFSDHPEAPGTTVPEFARVKAGKRVCQVKIGWFEVPLGAFHLDFFHSYDWDEIGDLDGWIRTEDLVTTAHVIRRAFEHDVELSEAADEFGVVFHQRPRSKEDDAVREYLSMSEEERERERERQRARQYEILGLSEDRVRQILEELTGGELYDCLRQTKLDRRAHIREGHPEDAPEGRTVERFLDKVIQKFAESPRNSRGHEVLMELVTGSISAYWSHVTEGHVASAGSAGDYLTSLARRSREA